MKSSGLYRVLMKSVPVHFPIMIKGPPGVGKSDLMAKVQKDLGCDLILMHPVVSDPTDAKGLPAQTGPYEADFIPFGDLKRMMEATRLTLVLVDDFGQAEEQVQKSFMQLVLARQINGKKISEHISFVFATNDRTHKSGVRGIIESMKTRVFSIIQFDFDLDDWVLWALDAGVPTEFIAYARFRPKCMSDFVPTAELTNGCCPRTFVQASKMYELGLDPRDEFEVLKGAVGEAEAGELTAFLKTYRELPSIDTVLLHPKTVKIPENPSVQYALVGAVAKRASEQTIERVIEFAGRLIPELNVLLLTLSEKECPEIVNTRAYIKWATENKGVLI
jgi:hypothetical protein